MGLITVITSISKFSISQTHEAVCGNLLREIFADNLTIEVLAEL